MSATPRTRTRLDPGVRREQILEAAERVFQGRDAVDVSLEEIAEAAGVSRALVYNYFGDKGGLIAAVYIRGLRRLDEELDQAIDPKATDPERLRATVRCYLSFARHSSAAWRLIGTTGAMEHPEVRAARQTRYNELAAAWGSTPEARLAARAVIGFLEAATLDWIDEAGLDLDRVSELLFTLLWRGLSSVADNVAHVPRSRPDAVRAGHSVPG